MQQITVGIYRFRPPGNTEPPNQQVAIANYKEWDNFNGMEGLVQQAANYNNNYSKQHGLYGEPQKANIIPAKSGDDFAHDERMNHSPLEAPCRQPARSD